MPQILINALRETLYMVLYSGLFSIALGIPFGILIANIANSPRYWLKSIYFALNSVVQAFNFIPYLLVMLIFIPTTNWLISRHISYTTATILPLGITGAMLLAHHVNIIFQELIKKWHNTTKSLGASQKQTLIYILLPESFSSMMLAATSTCASLVGFTVAAGALGAGGLGQLAIEKSIQDQNFTYVLICIATLVAIQQLIKYTGILAVQHKE